MKRSKCKCSQGEHRRSIDVGPGMFQVTPVSRWYRLGRYSTWEEAHAAFALAYQQGCDGMGTSVAGWMGLTEEEFEEYFRDRGLPALPDKLATHMDKISLVDRQGHHTKYLYDHHADRLVLINEGVPSRWALPTSTAPKGLRKRR